MKKIILIILYVYAVYSTFVNTTSFFQTQIGYSLKFQTFSGYQNIDWYYPPDQAAMYYSLWQAERFSLNDSKVPVIFWVHSGPPGAGGQFSCFNDHGPFFISGDTNATIMQNVWKWSNVGHLVFIDQPLGSGFSYVNGKSPGSTYEATRHFVNFMYNFMAEWKFQDNPIYIAGATYAGHFVPTFTRYLSTNVTMKLNIKGAIIGNGLVDPINQLNFYDSYLYCVGIVANQGRDVTTYIQNNAIVSILNQNYMQASSYMNWILSDDAINNKFYGGVNFQNFRLYDDGQINYNYHLYLNKNKKAFGIPDNINYIPLNTNIFNAFTQDISKSYADQLQYIMNKGLKMLIYSSQNDILMNTAGVLNYLNTLNWNGLRDWQKTTKVQWFIGNKNYGWVKKFKNFTYVLVKNSGHYVGVDQPRAGNAMINNFVNDLW